MGLVAYRNRLRVRRFLELASSGRLTLLAACLEAGFGSYPQFHRVFVAETGQTPRDYLAALRDRPPDAARRATISAPHGQHPRRAASIWAAFAFCIVISAIIIGERMDKSAAQLCVELATTELASREGERLWIGVEPDRLDAGMTLDSGPSMGASDVRADSQAEDLWRSFHPAPSHSPLEPPLDVEDSRRGDPCVSVRQERLGAIAYKSEAISVFERYRRGPDWYLSSCRHYGNRPGRRLYARAHRRA